MTTSAADGVATYQVLGTQGEPLGTVVREKALSGSGLRTRWTVTQTGCPEAVGYKGRIFWRTGKETSLEFQDDHVFLHAQWCDWRLGAALVALLRSFDSWLGTPWDDRRK
ncbi:hypothetical protein [Streptomyces sp. NBC_00623]|uniref:hypothetical protein n=1 Tax=Streptomyces sp. NBC_00623 TaxID=2975790 RepID=UPI0030E41FA9